MPASSQRRDPFPVYCFRVEIDEIDTATAFFKSVSGLKYETDVVDFQEGGTYLVSASDGEVSLCGLSAEKDDLLAGLYDEAYAG